MRKHQLRWVHLSDIHFAYMNFPTNHIRSSLLGFLNEKKGEHGFDCIFITGDVTDKNQTYGEGLFSFIADVLKTTEVNKNKLYLVPGNHDIEYSPERTEVLQRIFKEDNPCKAIENMRNEDYSILTSAQCKYWEMYEQVKGNRPDSEVHYIEEHDTYNVIHINTPWLSLDKATKDSIYIGIDRLYDCLKRAKISKESLNIAIGHHNLEWLYPNEREYLRSLFKEYGIDFYLSGHIHKSMIDYDHTIETYFCGCRQMKCDDYSGGLTIGTINTLNGDNRIEFYVWKADAGYWAIDNGVGIEARDGIFRIFNSKFPDSQQNEHHIIVVHKTMYIRESTNKLMMDLNLIDKMPEIHIYPYSNLEITSSEQWLEHKAQTEGFINKVTARVGNATLHICPLSQIPLLVYLGYLLGNGNGNIQIYQYNYEDKWVLESKYAPEIMAKSQIQEFAGSKKLLVIVEVSDYISENDIDEVQPINSSSILKISVDQPELAKVLFASQVKTVKQYFFHTINKYLSRFEEIHLFYSGPAGLAVEIGRCINKNMWPKVFLYHYRRNKKPKYELAFVVNE